MALGIFEIDTLRDVSGNAVVLDGATFEVRDESSGALAAIYEDIDGNNPITPHPHTLEAGESTIRFFVDQSIRFRVKITQGEYERTLRYRSAEAKIPEFGTAAEADIGTEPTEVPSNANLWYADIRSYGAVGENLSADKAALEAAIATGRPVFIPAGTWYVNDIDITDSVHIFGVHGKSILKKPDSTSGSFFVIRGYDFECLFRDLTIDSNYQGQTAAQTARVFDYLFEGNEGLGRPIDLVVDNCTFLNTEQDGIRYSCDSTVAGTSTLAVRNTRFFGAQPASQSFDVTFIKLSNGANALISGCVFDSLLDIDEDVLPCGVSIASRTETTVPGSYTVTGNDFYRCGRGGGVTNNLGAIEFYSDAARIVISNNKLYNCQGRAISGKSDTPYAIIQGNVIHNEAATSQGIIVTAAAHGSTLQDDTEGWLIDGNIIKNTTYSISVQETTSAEKIIVSNNLVIGFGASGFVHGIFMRGCTRVNVSNNVVTEPADDTYNAITFQTCVGLVMANDNNISGANIGILINGPDDTELVANGNIMDGITQRGIDAKDIKRIVARSNTIFGSGESAATGVRSSNATETSPIRGNLIEGFTTPVSLFGTTTNYVTDEND